MNISIKSILVLIATAFFLVGFILNTWFSSQMFQYNLKAANQLQTSLNNPQFIFFMNIVSNLFNPLICAGYIIVFYLLSHHRFNILVFLIWFIALSVFLSFMKTLIQQPRPYWIFTGLYPKDAQVQMLEWTCYTEFGCPSGHAMLGLVLIEFVIHHFIRRLNRKMGYQILVICIGVILEVLVAFSRVFLGMHSINQVLFGVMLGGFSLVAYYTYMQKCVTIICLKVCKKQNRKYSIIINILLIIILIIFSLLLTFAPKYPNNATYLANIQQIAGCSGTQQNQSFQYKCLQDSGLIMAAFGILFGFIFLKKQQRTMKVIMYNRVSKKYFIRLGVTVGLALIPVALFMNPLWRNIELQQPSQMAVMLYFLQSTGLFLGSWMMVGIAPSLLSKMKLEQYYTYKRSRQILECLQIPKEQKQVQENQLQTTQKKKQLSNRQRSCIKVPSVLG